MSIRFKLMGAFLLAIVLSIGSVIAIVSWEMKTATSMTYAENTQAQLARINSYIELLFSQTQENALFLAQSTEVRAALGTYPNFLHNTEPTRMLRADMAPEAQAVDAMFQNMKESHAMYGGIFLGEVSGRFMEFPTATWPPRHDPRTKPWYDAQLKSNKATNVSNAYATAQGVPSCAITAKVYEAGGDKVAAVLGIDINLSALVNMVSQIRNGQSGYLMLVEGNGTIIADPKHPESTFKNISTSPLPVLRSLLQRQDGMFVADVDGKSKLITVMSGYHGYRLVSLMDESEVYSATRDLLISIACIGSGIALVLLLLAFFLAQGIIRPIKAVVRDAQAVSEGRLDDMTDSRKFDGEMRVLHDSLQSMVANLSKHIQHAQAKSAEAEEQTAKARDALAEAEAARLAGERARAEGAMQTAHELEGIVSSVGSAAHDLHGYTESASHSAEVQSQRTTQAATAMEEMNASVIEVAANASQAAQNVEKARNEAQAGGQVVQEVVSSINEVQKVAHKLNTQLSELGEKAQDIGRIMDMISDVADQTNLLALNAAIEAARAGEAGRGFAVVADEVRKLAEKTMSATGEVGTVVSAIQSGAGNSVEGMHKVANLVDHSTTLAAQAGEALQRIVTTVQSSADQVRSIATASEQQSAASEEITQSTTEVNRLAEEMAEAMATAGKAVNGLREQTIELKGIIERLKGGE